MRRKELDGVILRWKKTTRALKIHEQEYGRYLTDLLGKRTDAELALFTDPVEAAAFFCLLDMTRRIAEAGGFPCVPGPQRTLEHGTAYRPGDRLREGA